MPYTSFQMLRIEPASGRKPYCAHGTGVERLTRQRTRRKYHQKIRKERGLLQASGSGFCAATASLFACCSFRNSASCDCSTGCRENFGSASIFDTSA